MAMVPLNKEVKQYEGDTQSPWQPATKWTHIQQPNNIMRLNDLPNGYEIDKNKYYIQF
jgi:hypothetical protein